MAQTLAPVTSDAYDLALQVFRLTPLLPKAQRYLPGQALERGALGVLFSLARANRRASRHGELEHASHSLDELRLVLRLACDLGYVSLDRHEALCVRMDSVGRQIGGWAKWAESTA
ncbi:MAG: four helix bundle protein [Polyangiaceae bacterium]|nr:four helix bundle protein [Polyangiaceae bacterium]